jgi:chemotaxis protein CheC
LRPTAEQLDAVGELVHIGFGRASGVLGELIQTPFELGVPWVRFYSAEEWSASGVPVMAGEVAAVSLPFDGAFEGVSFMVLRIDSAVRLIALLGGEPAAEEIDAVSGGTLEEVGNILLNAVLGSIANVLGERLGYSLPQFARGEMATWLAGVRRVGACVLLAGMRFVSQGVPIEGEVVLYLEEHSVSALLAAVDRAAGRRDLRP